MGRRRGVERGLRPGKVPLPSEDQNRGETGARATWSRGEPRNAMEVLSRPRLLHPLLRPLNRPCTSARLPIFASSIPPPRVL